MVCSINFILKIYNYARYHGGMSLCSVQIKGLENGISWT